MPKKRVLFLHSLPSPYRNPFFERFAKDKTYESAVYFMAKKAKNRVWKNDKLPFQHKFLPALTIHIKSKDDLIPIWVNPSIPLEIIKGKFDVVICSGWDSLGTFLASITCKLLNIPMLVWAGSTAREKSWRRTLAYWPVTLLVKNCSALIAYGKASRDYLLSLGAKKEKVFISYNSVDIYFFHQIAKKYATKKKNIRKKMGIENRYLVLFVGQLISRKGVLDLYQAVKDLSKEIDLGILWVGHGPLQTKLKTLAKKDKFKNQYFKTTFKQEETAQMYSLADIFVLPTYEDIYSNVVPEALASGLPVITTRENGVSTDYIKNKQNGFIIKAGDKKKLKEKIAILLRDDSLRKNMAVNTWDLIKNFNYNENVASFKKAIKYALNNK